MEAALSSRHRARGALGRPRLLLVGCGDVGLRIVARLHQRFRVLATTTQAARVPALRAAGAVPLVIDLDRARAVRRLRALAPRVIHLAPPPAQGSTDPRSRRLAVALRGGASSQRRERPAAALGAPARAHAGRLRRQASRHQAPPRTVYISTTGVWGDHRGAWIDETTPVAPTNARAVRRVAAERTLRAQLQATVLRVPGIYAADRLPLDRLRQGLPALTAADDVHTNHIHADDLARLAIAALARGGPARVIATVDHSGLLMGDYFDRVADRFGLPRPPRLARGALRAAVSPVMLSFMSESRRIRNTRMTRELRTPLAWPTVDALLASLPVHQDAT